MIEIRYAPLVDWPGTLTPSYERRSRYNAFRSDYADTLRLLRKELDMLDAKDVVLQVAYRPGDVRTDGQPRRDARAPQHPGVILSFTSKHGPLRYLTDEFELWEHNVRAIALGLEALRKVDRYGITKSGEQYTGWAALPAGTDHATAVLFSAAGLTPGPLANGEAEKLYRKALKATHPDHGGDAERFREVQAAAESLGLR